MEREQRAMGCIESGARPQSRGAQRYGRPASAGRAPRVGTAGDGVHRKRSPSTKPWCAAAWTACFSGEGPLCGNGGRWGASKAQPVHRAVVRLRHGRPASAGTVPCAGTAGDGVHRKRSPSTEPWCAAVWTACFSGEGSSCGNGGRWGASEAEPVHRAVVRNGMDGPLQRGGFLVRERRAIKSPAYGAASGEPDLDRGRSPRVTSPHSPTGANTRQIPKIGESQIANPQSTIRNPLPLALYLIVRLLGHGPSVENHGTRNTQHVPRS